MSNIVKKPETILTRSEQQLQTALMQPKLMDLSPQQKEASMLKLIAAVFANVNEKSPSEMVFLKMKADLLELMETEFKAMRVDEIKIALDWGSDNWEGHGISSKLIKGWIRTWRQTKKLEIQKSIAIKSKRDKKDSPPRELTKEEKLQSIQRQFERHLSGLKPFTSIFVYLKVFGWLTSDEDKPRIFDKAIKQLTQETKENENRMAKPFRDQRLRELSEAKNERGLAKYILNRCHEIAIIELFNGMVEMETTPEELINNQ